MKLTFQAKSKMDIKQHEQEIRTMINNNKQLTEQLGMQSFTSLIADLCQNINILSSYSMYPNGIFPRRNALRHWYINSNEKSNKYKSSLLS